MAAWFSGHASALNLELVALNLAKQGNTALLAALRSSWELSCYGGVVQWSRICLKEELVASNLEGNTALLAAPRSLRLPSIWNLWL